MILKATASRSIATARRRAGNGPATDLKITTDPLDLDDILREAAGSAAMPARPTGMRIGHVHLRVGDVARGGDILSRRHRA